MSVFSGRNKHKNTMAAFCGNVYILNLASVQDLYSHTHMIHLRLKKIIYFLQIYPAVNQLEKINQLEKFRHNLGYLRVFSKC